MDTYEHITRSEPSQRQASKPKRSGALIGAAAVLACAWAFYGWLVVLAVQA